MASVQNIYAGTATQMNVAGDSTHEKRVSYSALVDKKLRKDCVALSLFNTNYEGVPTSGAVMIPVRDTEVAVGDYAGYGVGGAMTQGATSYQTLVIDNEKFVNEYINGYDAASVPDALVADRIDSAGYALANTIDTYLLNVLATQGTIDSDTTALTAKNIYTKIVDARTTLRDASVPMSGCTLVVSPATYALLLKSDEFIKAGDMSQSMVINGVVGMIAGFPVVESNNLPSNVEFIIANKGWCTFVDAWKVPVKVVSLDGDAQYIGDSAVKGRIVYAAKVTKPAAVLVKTV